jgi:hypothetical protein
MGARAGARAQSICETLDTSCSRELDFDRASRENWFEVLTGRVRYCASTSWSPAAAIGVFALIVSVQLGLSSTLYLLSPELYRVISGGQEFGSGGLGLSLLQQIVGCRRTVMAASMTSKRSNCGLLQHVPTGVNRDSQRTPKERV